MQNLFDRLANADETALDEIYELFHIKVYNTVLGYLQNQDDAEEITQDVFVEIFKSASKFKGQSSPGTWIYRIAVNKSLDFIRYKQRKKRFADVRRLFSGSLDSPVLDIPDFNHPGVVAENKENAAILFKVIDTLPENQKTAFILSYVEELSRQEVADIMEVTLKSVDSLLFRAKGSLKNKLSDYYPNRVKKK
ncbi:MAG: RNA polymerase sigma factor [Cyclobacteriaceae bacterium]